MYINEQELLVNLKNLCINQTKVSNNQLSKYLNNNKLSQ
jgi:hypothetical protein